MSNIFDSQLSLDEFKAIYNADPETRATLLEAKREELRTKENKKWAISQKSEVNEFIQQLTVKKDELIATKNTLNENLSKMSKADNLFKGYQKVTLGGVLEAAPNREIGAKMCMDLHRAVQQALQTGDVNKLQEDIKILKQKHNKQSLLGKLLKRKQNKQLDEALNQAVQFVVHQKEQIQSNQYIKTRFCDESEYKHIEDSTAKDVAKNTEDIRQNENMLQKANNDLKEIDTAIERNVNYTMDPAVNIPKIDLKQCDGAGIMIEDEANIAQAASFDMVFIKGDPSFSDNKDINKAAKAAKLIAAAGFNITDNPEEAKQTNSFYLRDNEIFTPFIAKEDMPKYKALLQMLQQNGAEPSNFNIPTQPHQILREKPQTNDEINVSALVGEAFASGQKGDGYGKPSELAIAEKYNNRDFLYRGTATSDATYAGSARNGRQGIIYATTEVVNAAAYSGCKSKEGGGESGTGDKYVDNKVTFVADGKVTTGYIGFIHVYENHNNKMYSNWQVENKNYTKGDENYETFLKQDNKHVATYLTISVDGRNIDAVFEIPKDDTRWQKFIQQKGVDPECTYLATREGAKSRTELFERMKAQLQEVKTTGQVATLSFDGIETAAPEYMISQIEKDNNLSSRVHESQPQITPPPITEDMMSRSQPQVTPPPITEDMMRRSQPQVTPPPITEDMMRRSQPQVTPPPITEDMMSRSQPQVTPPPITEDMMRVTQLHGENKVPYENMSKQQIGDFIQKGLRQGKNSFLATDTKPVTPTKEKPIERGKIVPPSVGINKGMEI